MTEESPYAQIEKDCPSCGQRNVWLCSQRDCPMSAEQSEVRKGWVDRMSNPPEELENGVRPRIPV